MFVKHILQKFVFGVKVFSNSGKKLHTDHKLQEKKVSSKRLQLGNEDKVPCPRMLLPIKPGFELEL